MRIIVSLFVAVLFYASLLIECDEASQPPTVFVFASAFMPTVTDILDHLEPLACCTLKELIFGVVIIDPSWKTGMHCPSQTPLHLTHKY